MGWIPPRVDADMFVLESMKQEYSYGIFMPKPHFF